ncbi:MAG: hypothetical protein WBC22_01520 [Sedimentisphaerales bacterium]
MNVWSCGVGLWMLWKLPWMLTKNTHHTLANRGPLLPHYQHILIPKILQDRMKHGNTEVVTKERSGLLAMPKSLSLITVVGRMAQELIRA